MSSNSITPSNTAKAQVDFCCLSEKCEGVVKFNLIDVSNTGITAQCPVCHHLYQFDEKLSDKLIKLKNLITAVREAENILGDCNVAVTVPAGEVKIPYVILLTRLNTMISLNIGDRKVDFHFWVEPSSSETFR